MLIKMAIFSIIFIVVGVPVFLFVRKLWEAGAKEEEMYQLKKDLLSTVDEELKTPTRVIFTQEKEEN